MKTIRDYFSQKSFSFFFMGLMIIVKLLYNYFHVSRHAIFNTTTLAIGLGLLALGAIIFLSLTLFEQRFGSRPVITIVKGLFLKFLIIAALLIYYGFYMMLLLNNCSWPWFFIFFGVMIIRDTITFYMNSRTKLEPEY